MKFSAVLCGLVLSRCSDGLQHPARALAPTKWQLMPSGMVFIKLLHHALRVHCLFLRAHVLNTRLYAWYNKLYLDFFFFSFFSVQSLQANCYCYKHVHSAPVQKRVSLCMRVNRLFYPTLPSRRSTSVLPPLSDAVFLGF